MRHATYLIISAFVLVSACTVPNDTAVKAIDLTNGETRVFSSVGEVPSGWAVCDDDICETVPETVPCQNLGSDVCSLNPQCRLRTLECVQSTCSGIAPEVPSQSGGMSGGSESGGSEPGNSGAAGDPLPGGTDCETEPQCEYACVHKDELFCEEVKDKSACLQRSDCNWGQVMCPAVACVDGGDCDIACPASCYADTPPSCGQLDELSCEKRSDCQWSPGVCPLCAHEDGTACECQPFCQDKSGTNCPTVISPPPGYCPDGEISFKYDAQGCVVSYVCQAADCPAIGMVACEKGRTVPIYDSRGCVVGYECDDTIVTNTTCNDLAASYSQTLQAAKACNAAAVAPTSCDKQVADNLGCGCFTYVDASNVAAIQKLEDLATQWEKNNCDSGLACPAMPCWVPDGATCAISSTLGTGTCQDNAS